MINKYTIKIYENKKLGKTSVKKRKIFRKHGGSQKKSNSEWERVHYNFKNKSDNFDYPADVDVEGTAEYPIGNYDGHFSEGYREGRGIFIWSDGDTYDGEWKDDKLHGKGIYKWKNGTTYDGEWEDDKRNGTGILRESNGNTYDGELLDGKKHGTGLYTWGNGDTYQGLWKDDKRHGTGLHMYKKDGKLITEYGKWEDGEKRVVYEYTTHKVF